MDTDSDIESLPDLDVFDVQSFRHAGPSNQNIFQRNKRRRESSDSDIVEITDDERPMCTCSTSTGNSHIMCGVCRLQPPHKKARGSPSRSESRASSASSSEIIDLTNAPVQSYTNGRHFTNVLEPELTERPNTGGFRYEEEESTCFPSTSSSHTEQADSDEVNDMKWRHVKAVTQNRTAESDVQNAGFGGRNMNCVNAVRIPVLWSTARCSMRNPKKPVPGRTVYPFEATKIFAVNACESDTEEQSEKQKSQFLEMVRDFCNKREEPPADLTRKMLTLLLYSADDNFALKVHRYLLEMLEVNPPNMNLSNPLPFDDPSVDLDPMFCDIFSELNLGLGVFDQMRAKTGASTLASTLALDYIVHYLESDLVHRQMGKALQLTKCAAHSFLKEDRLTTVILYLQRAIISYNEYDQGGLLLNTIDAASADEKRVPLSEIDKVVPLLQRLLDLFIVTAHKEADMVGEIASEIKGVYFLCCFEKKQLLLKTIVSSRLRLKLIYLILMDTHSACGDDVPRSFRTLKDVTFFFRNIRPFVRTAETPPSSPREGSAGAWGNDTEEIAFLLYNAVFDYLTCEERNLHAASSARYLARDEPRNLGAEDQFELRRMSLRVGHLRECLETMAGSSNLSPKTLFYLEQIKVTCDLRNRKREEEVTDVIVL